MLWRCFTFWARLTFFGCRSATAAIAAATLPPSPGTCASRSAPSMAMTYAISLPNLIMLSFLLLRFMSHCTRPCLHRFAPLVIFVVSLRRCQSCCFVFCPAADLLCSCSDISRPLALCSCRCRLVIFGFIFLWMSLNPLVFNLDFSSSTSSWTAASSPSALSALTASTPARLTTRARTRSKLPR